MTPPTRVFVAGLSAEINTFVETPTTLDDFAAKLLARGGIDDVADGYATTPSKIWSARARARGWAVAPGTHASARPGGPLTQAAYESLRAEILDGLRASGPADVVFLSLHGAMVAEGQDDCEGDLLARAREIAGPSAVIGVQLDSHCHLTRAMLDNATAIVVYKTYPHVDYRERAEELWRLVEGARDGRISPTMAAVRLPVLGLFPTSRPAIEPAGPMPELTAELAAWEGRDGVLSMSLAGGFPWADLPITGGAALAVTDADSAGAARRAQEAGRRFLAIAADAALRFVPVDEALERVESAPAGPVLLSDAADQTGGGAPGDSTFVLEAMLSRGMTDSCLGPLCDPAAVEQCFRAGVGAVLPLSIGGHGRPAHSGRPVDVRARVLGVSPDSWQSGLNGERFAIGDVAVVDVAGVEILLSRARLGVYTPSLFANHGVDLAAKRCVVVKNLYRHAFTFAALCPEMILLAAPGACSADWAALPYRRLTRPIWPLDVASPTDLRPVQI